MGTVYNAIGFPKYFSDEQDQYGSSNNGADFKYLGFFLELIFRESTTGDLYASRFSEEVRDVHANTVNASYFDIDDSGPTDTFGSVNPRRSD